MWLWSGDTSSANNFLSFWEDTLESHEIFRENSYIRVKKVFTMDKDLLGYFLLAELLEHFTIIKVEELEEVSMQRNVLHIELEEKNQLPQGYDSSQYESKGFYPVKIIQDFPIRGKAVYLLIKRRCCREKLDKNKVIHSDYRMIASGSKLTQELSDFLKDRGR